MRVAISACLLGEACRYDGANNLAPKLLERYNPDTIIPFCPENFTFGTPRATMDLVESHNTIWACSNATGEDLSTPIVAYAKDFFDTKRVDLLIGKSRSPSCGVCTARVYDEDKSLLSSSSDGLFVVEAKKRGIKCIDSLGYEDRKR